MDSLDLLIYLENTCVIYLKCREKETELSIRWLTPQTPTHSQARAGSHSSIQVFSVSWQGPTSQTHHLLPPRNTLTGSWSQERELGLEPGSLIRDADVPSRGFIARRSGCP